MNNEKTPEQIAKETAEAKAKLDETIHQTAAAAESAASVSSETKVTIKPVETPWYATTTAKTCYWVAGGAVAIALGVWAGFHFFGNNDVAEAAEV